MAEAVQVVDVSQLLVVLLCRLEGGRMEGQLMLPFARASYTVCPRFVALMGGLFTL